MSTNVLEIPHTEIISQLARHLSSIPPRRSQFHKRGSVAIVLRLHADQLPRYTSRASQLQSLHAFLAHKDVRAARAQVLYIQRAAYPGDPWSGHIGFPGGKREDSDRDDKMTAVRETQEELGLDIGGEGFEYLGELDTCHAYMWFNLQTMMVVVPHVFLQVVGRTPELRVSAEVASAHWIDLGQLLKRVQTPCAPFTEEYRSIPLDVAARVFPRSRQKWWYWVMERVLGTTHYTVLPLEFAREFSVVRSQNRGSVNARYRDVRFASDKELFLWGISLEITSGLVDLALPASAALHPAYVSVASPWPQMDRRMWADVNWITNALHAHVWGPRRRKPYKVTGLDFFRAHAYALRLALGLSLAARAWAVYYVARTVQRLLAK
ncbi:hypothetical protein DL89DRAFT_267010 [Linderina pennispora]|uniref:Nudix hydrolase domain-containing protein n=1 Tax=Linderina pennispora TaxID=61395 RepID=A0A1Y1WBJ0_9FUNG|nr:uncharacterized protein DL89DRAFT_267010 [Linderina pennispora]ORX70909.1 hypothetical protein DL89DRAFT_267010 [Linderina pennispora]